MLPTSRSIAAWALAIGLTACAAASADDSPTSPDPTSPTPPAGNAARVATLDSVRINVPAGAIVDPTQWWETNAALYFLVADPAAAITNAGSTVMRYVPAGSTFQTGTTPVYASSIRPASETSDGATAFSTYWVSTPAEKAGQLSINSAFPSRVMNFAETGDLVDIIPDRSGTARDWAIGMDANARYQVVRKSASVSAPWAVAARPAQLGSALARGVGMQNGKLYLGVGNAMYVITDTGIERTIPLTLFGSGTLMTVNKVVGGNDASSVYIGYGTKVLRLSTTDGSLTEMMTVKLPNPLGTFCVNSGRVYTNDGMKSALNELGTPASYVKTSGTVSSADQARLTRIESLLAAGAPMCLNESTTITASVFVVSGNWIYRIGSI
jgi:hypothetical protein